MSNRDFCDFAEQHNIRVRFAIIYGGIRGWKSTAINQFRNLVVLDEWLEERPPSWQGLSQLTDDEKKAADDWIVISSRGRTTGYETTTKEFSF